MSLNKLRDDVHGLAKEKGWYDPGFSRTLGEQLCLIHSEISEALEELRSSDGRDVRILAYDGAKPVGFPSELADILIRTLDLCGHLDIDIDKAVTEKHAYNKTRPYRHGGKNL